MNVATPSGIQLAELVAVVGQEVLRRELEQHGVVALERREDVGVGLQRREAVAAQVAGAAARLAAGLDRVGRVAGRDRLQPGRQRLQLAPTAIRHVRRGEHLVQARHQALLREVQPVGRGERGEEAALVRPVVQQQHLGAAGRAELAPGERVPDGQVERDLRRADRRAADAHPALDQRPEHDEEALGRVLDRAEVRPVLAHLGVAVQQRRARHAHAVERDPAVVHAVQPQLRPAVLDRDPGEHRAVLVAQRDEQRVHAARLAADDELGEHGGHAPVARGVADVVLARVGVRRVDDELARVRVVRRGRAEGLDVGAVAGLRHREAADQVERGDRGQVRRVVALGAEVQHRAAEQPELHAALDEQREVAERERLERGDRSPDLALAAVLDRVADRGAAGVRQLLRPRQHLRAVLLARQVDGGRVAGKGEPCADRRADRGVGPVEVGAEGVGRGHAARLPRYK